MKNFNGTFLGTSGGGMSYKGIYLGMTKEENVIFVDFKPLENTNLLGTVGKGKNVYIESVKENDLQEDKE